MARRKRLFSIGEILFMTVPLAMVASIRVHPPLWIYLLHSVGRIGQCPLPNAVASIGQLERFNASTLELIKQSRLAEKSDRGYVRWVTPHGEFWSPSPGSTIFLLSEQVNRVYGDGPRRVQPGDVVLDCGANIGTFTWEALNAGAKLVVAIEPSERNVECLRLNFPKQIAEGRVIVYPKGVWHREETLRFNVFDNSALDSAIISDRPESGGKPKTISFPVTTIDQIVRELKLNMVNFIKMDIEGAERNAIQGANETLSRFHPRMSIAMENLKDDQYVVPPLVRAAWSGYHVECGRCSAPSRWEIRPDVMYFY